MERLQDFSDMALSLGRKALFPVMLGAAACTPDEVTAPSGGGSEEVDTGDDVRDLIDEVHELSASECEAFLAAAEDNPESDVNLNPLTGSLISGWDETSDGGVLTYEEDFEVESDSVYEGEARSLLACTAWDIENAQVFSDWTIADREGSELTIMTEATPEISAQATGLTVWVMADHDNANDDLRLVGFGRLDELTHPIDTRANPPEILE